MRHTLKLFTVLLALAVALPASSAFAERRVALVIGNSDYATMGRLRNPKNDADLVASSFQAMGFEVTKLVDLSERDMGNAVDDFANAASDADVAAVYFAGHGLQKDGENFLMPVDADVRTENAIAREGISLSSVKDALELAPISLLFLDACRNNPFADAIARTSKSRSAGVSRGLAVIRPSGDMLVAFATLPNTTAADGEGANSPFAAALARHMKTPNVEVSVMMKRVNKDVFNETGGEQRPQQLSQMQTEFYFAKTDGGNVIAPAPATPVKVNAPQPAPSASGHQELPGLLTVYPHRVKLDEEVSVVADLPNGCVPFFFNLSPGKQLTPIPLKFFAKEAKGSERTRYEISPGSRYGLVVTKTDENGTNKFGYLCQPSGLTDKTAIRDVLKAVIDKMGTGIDDGTVTAGGYQNVAFQVRPFEIYGN